MFWYEIFCKKEEILVDDRKVDEKFGLVLKKVSYCANGERKIVFPERII